jgi:excisionase family DNA binding protein
MNLKNRDDRIEIFTPGKLLSAEEVASILNVKPATILEWALKGKIPSLKLSDGKKGIVRFNGDKLNNWLEKKEREPGDTGKTLRKAASPGELVVDKGIKKDFENFVASL